MVGMAGKKISMIRIRRKGYKKTTCVKGAIIETVQEFGNGGLIVTEQLPVIQADNFLELLKKYSNDRDFIQVDIPPIQSMR